jgi:hypothetical protein
LLQEGQLQKGRASNIWNDRPCAGSVYYLAEKSWSFILKVATPKEKQPALIEFL